MYISRLKIFGFGCLTEKELNFSCGLNLIATPNETGKSTLLHAIIAILYGTTEVGLHRRKKLPWHTSYLPDNHENYGGEIEYTHQNTQYKLIRNLHQQTAASQLINLTECREITYTFLLEKKERNFLKQQLSLSRAEFIKFCVICPSLLTKNSFDLALTEKLRLLLCTAGETEITTAITDLNHQLTELGERKGTKTAIGRLLIKIEKLQQDLNELRLHTKEYITAKQELQKLKKKIIQQEELLRNQYKLLQKLNLFYKIEHEFILNQRLLDTNTKQLSRFILLFVKNKFRLCLLILILILFLCKLYLIGTISFTTLCLRLVILKKNTSQDECLDIIALNTRQAKLIKLMTELSLFLEKKPTVSQQRFQENQALLYNLKLKYQNLVGVTETLSKLFTRLTAKENELHAAQQEYNQLKRRRAVIVIAKEQLLLAAKNLQNILGPKISAAITSYLPLLTNNRYRDAIFNTANFDLKIFANKSHSYITLDKLSTGTFEQVLYALRLGLLNLLNNHLNFPLPLLLDDAFVYFDDQRLEQALLAIFNLSKKHQILLCTCQNREKKLLDRLSIPYKNLSL
ncbi:MAG: hypothetical protein RLZ12_513 [Bacillota bacterium]